MYCNDGEKVTVRYRFGGNQEEIFQTTGKISVVTGTEGRSANYNPRGYGLRFYSTNNFRWLEYVVIDYEIFDAGGGGLFRYAIRLVGCNGAQSSVNLDPSTVEILDNRTCPNPQQPENCYIEISKNGGGIFRKTGKCPITFNVVCGDECPPNHIKCPCDSYPGYCCIPCSEIRNGIAAATAAVRRINLG